MSGKRSVAKEAARLLAGLGDTPDEIAAMLRGAGYKGAISEGRDCPCGSCLRDHLGTPVHVSQTVVFEGRVPDPFDESLGWPLSQAVRTFILMFDGGIYPDLIEEKP